jgi:hypothetical protein
VTRCAAAVSEHPVAAHATGEIAGAVLEALGPQAPPDVAFLFSTAAHTGALSSGRRPCRSWAATWRSRRPPG